MRSADLSSDTKILLVEDEAIIALDLRQRLQGLGYEVTGIAANGADAQALARSTQPTLIFMDITIQGPIDGIETAKRISGQMDVPIVFLTAHTDTGTIRRAKEAKPYGYLVKPFEERELSATIEMAVYRHKTEAKARLLQHAITSASTGIVVADARDPRLSISICNPAFERITGYPSAEIVGQSPWFLEGQDTDATASADIRRALEDRRDCQMTMLVRRKDGTPLWTDVALSAVRNSVGEVTHFLFFHTDATARKHGIHAVPLAGRLRTIIKDVAQVRVAAAANDFGAGREPSAVSDLAHVVGRDRLEEARPAGAGFELRVGIKQLLAATDAAVHARFVVVPIGAGEGSLGPFFSSDFELLRSQSLLPLGVVFCNRQQTWIGFVRRVHRGSLSNRRIGLVARRSAGEHPDCHSRADDSRENGSTLEHGSILRLFRKSRIPRFANRAPIWLRETIQINARIAAFAAFGGTTIAGDRHMAGSIQEDFVADEKYESAARPFTALPFSKTRRAV